MPNEKAVISMATKTVAAIFVRAHHGEEDKPKVADVENNELRNVVADLNEINKKLDSLPLKALDISCSFLKEGISFLIFDLRKAIKDQENRGEATCISNATASGGLNTDLPVPQAMERFHLPSEEQLEQAKKSFRKAGENATLVFSNESLSTKERIMACTIRVVARIFESGLEDPGAATVVCLFAIEELQELPAVQDMLEVFVNGGIRSWFNTAERFENIMSVLLINHALFDFAAKCSSKYPNVFNWPTIKLADRTFHPILHAGDIVEKTSSSEDSVQQLNRMVVGNRISGHRWYCAVNSCGGVILLDDDKITVIYDSGESKVIMLSNLSESNVIQQKRKAVAVDSDDNVYVVRYLKTSGENSDEESFVFCVLDKNFNVVHESILLDFLKAEENKNLKIAVDKNKNIIMIREDYEQVYVCDSSGQLKDKFERDGFFAWDLVISDHNDIMITLDDDTGVQVYTTEGYLKSTIKVPEGHDVFKVAFHHGIRKLIFSTINWKEGSLSLLCYSETGELEHLVREIPGCSNVLSHPSRRFALLRDNIITWI